MKVKVKVINRIHGREPKHMIDRIKVLGTHSLSPPKASIKKEVEGWLKKLQLPAKKDVCYTLEIASWKRYAGRYGAWAFQVLDHPYETIIEIRVRVPEASEFLWCCRLICPSGDYAWDIVAWSNKEAFYVLHELEKLRTKENICLEQLPSSRAERRYVQKHDRGHPVIVVNNLMKSKVLKPLCFALWKAHGKEPFLLDELIALASKISGLKIEGEAQNQFVEAILCKGIGVPCPKYKDSSYLRASETIEERALDYEEEQRQTKLERLINREKSLKNNREAAIRETERLRTKVLEADKRIKNMLEEEGKICKEIETLRSESISETAMSG